MTEHSRETGLVSIVITNYNKARYLTECLEGLLNQTYDNWEMILIDDCSTDDSVDVAKSWLEAVHREGKLSQDNAFTLISLPSNIGYAGAMTLGMYLAKGQYIAIQDSDDISHPNRLQRQVAYLEEHRQIELLGTNYAVFEEKQAGAQRKAGWLKYGDEICSVYAAGGHCVCHGTIMIRGELFDRKGGLTRRVTGAEDYDFIARCLASHSRNVENLREVLYFYRRHADQRSRQYFGKDKDRSGGDGS
jgi:glycosyltransferase involved in cell wall biosynthesis